jgi:hypothetical protein
MIGPECFQTLNPEGHWEAVAQFTREEAERRTIAYLIANLHLNVPAREVIERALPTLSAIDQVLTTLQQRINEVLRIDLWRYVGRGVLNVNETGRRMRRSRDGIEEVVDFLDERQLHEFPGYPMFSPKVSRLASRISGCAKRLSFINFGDEVEERVSAMDTEDQARAARILSNGIATAAGIFEEANAIRQGFNGMSIAMLKGWTKHKGCPIRLSISGDDGSFYIGADDDHPLRIEIPPFFWRGFGELPKILTVSNWNDEA